MGDFHAPSELWFCRFWFPAHGSAVGNIQLHDQEQDTSHHPAGSQPLGCFTELFQSHFHLSPPRHLGRYSEYCICV